MRRLILAAAAAVSLSGCVAMGGPGTGNGSLDPMDATPVTYDFEPSTLAKVGNAVVAVPATVVWWPYKIASSALRGGYDGVAGGVGRAPVPFVGIVAAPLTAAAGVVNGTFAGVSRGPAIVKSPSEFGRALGKPWKEPIPLWKEER